MKTGLWWKAATALCAGLMILIAVAVLVRLSSPTVRVKVLDPKLRMVSASVVRSRRNTFYLGNQTEGRARDFLKNELHLNVNQFYRVPIIPIRGPEAVEQPHSILMIQFSVQVEQSPASPFMDENNLDAVLRDSAGNVVAIPTSFLQHNYGSKLYWQAFDLDRVRSNAGNYKILLNREHIRVAEVEVFGLPAVYHKPYHVGPNAF